jgi:hypothetical protein
LKSGSSGGSGSSGSSSGSSGEAKSHAHIHNKKPVLF